MNPQRIRIVIEDVGGTFVEAPLIGAPTHGTILRFKATADSAEDSAASVGTTGANDISAALREAPGVTGYGGNAGATGSAGEPLLYAFTPLTPSLSIDSLEGQVVYQCPNDVLYPTIAVRLTPAADATGTVVVVVDIEPFNPTG